MNTQVEASAVASQIGNLLNILSGGIGTTLNSLTQNAQAPTTPASTASFTGGTSTSHGSIAGAGVLQGGVISDLEPFYQQLLQRIGAPVTDANMAFMRAWHQAEGSDPDNWNPFNTTQDAPGATIIPSQVNGGPGVKIYPDFNTGLQATADTLMNGSQFGYDAIVNALRAGNDPNAAAQAVANSSWGTEPFQVGGY